MSELQFNFQKQGYIKELSNGTPRHIAALNFLQHASLDSNQRDELAALLRSLRPPDICFAEMNQGRVELQGILVTGSSRGMRGELGDAT